MLALTLSEAVVPDVVPAVALVAEGDSATELAGGHEVAAQGGGFGLGDGCSPLGRK